MHDFALGGAALGGFYLNGQGLQIYISAVLVLDSQRGQGTLQGILHTEHSSQLDTMAISKALHAADQR